jgi:alkylhydroperoxidase family enzyme
MAHIDVPSGNGLERLRLWEMAPHFGAGVDAMRKATYEASSLPARVREVARMRIAQINECPI